MQIRKFLSVLLSVLMVLSLFPATVLAASSTVQLNAGPGKTFDLQQGDSVTYTFTAPADGIYLYYDQAVTGKPVCQDSSSAPMIDCYDRDFNENGIVQIRVYDMKQNDILSVTYTAHRDPATGIVGINTPQTFRQVQNMDPMDRHDPKVTVDIEDGTLGLRFSTDNWLTRDVTWTAVSSDPAVLEFLPGNSSTTHGGSVYNPVFALNGIGDVTITIAASCNGTMASADYTVRVWDDPQEHFSSFAELKALIQKHDGSYMEARAEDNAQIIITEDITIPDNMEIYAYENNYVKIAPGVTVTTGDHPFGCSNLDVAGTLNVTDRVRVEGTLNISGTVNAPNGDLDLGNTLSVTGTLILGDQNVSMEHPASISGFQNIDFRNDGNGILIRGIFHDVAGLEAVSQDIAANYIDHDRVSYIIRYREDGPNTTPTSFTIDRDITVPAHAELQLEQIGTYTLAAGKTLTLDGSINICTEFIVNGTLVNNQNLYIQNENTRSCGTLDITGGTYSGSGNLRINGDKNRNPSLSDLLTGLNLADFDINHHIDPGGYPHWDLRYIAGLIKLGTPTNLQWHIEYMEEWKYDETTDTFSLVAYHPTLRIGYMSWETALPDQAHAIIKLYEVGNPNPVYEWRWEFGTEVEPVYRSIDLFLMEDFPSGTYYFSVTSAGDYVEYRNSDEAFSGTFTYTCPNNELAVPTNLQWVGTGISWEAPADRTWLDGYHVLFYYSETPNGSFEQWGNFTSRQGPNGITAEQYLGWVFQKHGVGYYKFKIKALTSDITQSRNSEWSAFSPVLDLTKLPQDVSNDLGDLMQNLQNNPAASADDIRTAVQSMDKEDLKTAMLADHGDVGVLDNLEALENLAGGPANVSVSQDAAAFDANKISIVGANLNNNTSSNGDDITLVVDKPETNHIIPELYNSAVAVSFSMTLSNVDDPQNLEVPVKITLPVPANINPDFLVILHYHADGTHETIFPRIYWDDQDQMMYASFVLTSFSDFIMTQYGDMPTVSFRYENAPEDITPPDPYTVDEGDTVYLLAPDTVPGYIVAWESADVEISHDGNEIYFIMPDTDVLIIGKWTSESGEEEFIPVKVSYKINTNAENGTVTADGTRFLRGQKVTVTVTPDAGYVLKGLTATRKSGAEVRVTKNADGTYTFTMPASSVTVNAEFVLAFEDITTDHQFYPAIQWVFENGLMNGVTETNFDRVNPVTRQQVWRILARLINNEDPGSMAAAKEWAMAQGITDGTNPGTAATREEFITMLWMAYGKPAADTTVLAQYTDAAAISADATAAMAWAVSEGIVGGYDDGTLRPTATASRGAFAAVLYRYLAK